MTDVDTFGLAFGKAIKGGWDFFGWAKYQPQTTFVRDPALPYFLGVEVFIDHPEVGEVDYKYSLYDIIFNSGFAEALWPNTLHGKNYTVTYWWKHHLQELAIADDKLKYLEANI